MSYCREFPVASFVLITKEFVSLCLVIQILDPSKSRHVVSEKIFVVRVRNRCWLILILILILRRRKIFSSRAAVSILICMLHP